MAVTMQDVARYAAVSTATVSRVLNNPQMVNKETRQHVLEAIKTLNYRMNPAARSLRTSRSYRIAVVVSDLANPVIATTLEALEDAALRESYGLQLCMAYADQSRAPYCIDMLTQQNAVDGVVWMAQFVDTEALDHLERIGIPVLWVHHQIGLGFDYHFVAYYAATHLLQSGHRHIAMLIRGDDAFRAARIQGYKDAFAKENLSSDPMLIFDVTSEWDMFLDGLAGESFTAVIADDDTMAARVYQACAALGREIPREVSVIGCGDYAMLRYLQPSLSTFRLPAAELGRRAFDALLKYVEGETDFDDRMLIEPQFIQRDSVAPR